MSLHRIQLPVIHALLTVRCQAPGINVTCHRVHVVTTPCTFQLSLFAHSKHLSSVYLHGTGWCKIHKTIY